VREVPFHLQPGSASWPTALDLIDCPPDDLWGAGQLEALTQGPRIAIVGSRGPTAYGLDQATRFAAAFARQGWVVVSGLARGVDQAAHRAALDAGGTTVAVLGCGVDRPWPDGPLARSIRTSGLLLSEFSPGTPPRRHHFPLRNRIISGLSTGVLVIEAARRSGSLITARWALDQGKTVFALPGRVDNPLAAGTLALIRDGATPVGSPAELLADLIGTRPLPEAGAQSHAAPETALIRALRTDALTPDELCRRLGIPLAEVLVELVQGELDGFIARSPGGLFRLIEHR
jgi:DNA processing protein